MTDAFTSQARQADQHSTRDAPERAGPSEGRSPPTGLLTARVMRLQRLAGNAQVARMIQAARAAGVDYPANSAIHIARQQHPPGPEDKPIGDVLGASETVNIAGDPTAAPTYVQNVVKGVGIFGWGGPFRLDRQVVNGMGVDSVLLPRTAVSLDSDPLSKAAAAINLVYKTREAADKAVGASKFPGAYTFYIGPGDFIYPTIISDSTAPALCKGFRAAVVMEQKDAKAAENLSINLALWYVGARFPMKVGTAPVKGGAALASAGGAGKSAFTVVEIGAGDLKASIELAKKGIKVIAVDPVAPSAAAVAELKAVGGAFVQGTATKVAAGVADQVFQYFPWRIGGTGRMAIGGSGTWSLVSDTLRILKSGGNAFFVTEDLATAEFLAKEAASRGMRAVITETAAGAAAPGASGAAVPNFSAALKVWLVNIYK